MLKFGTKVIHKASNQKGYIVARYSTENHPTGYNVVTEDDIHHICLGEDIIELNENEN